MRDKTVAVIGAGPAGSFASYLLKKIGIKKVLLFDKSNFPRIKPCAGGLSPFSLNLLKRHGFLDEIRPISYLIEGMELATPDRDKLILDGVTQAYVSNRKDFDFFLLKKALKEGAEFFSETKIDRLIHHKGYITGVGSKNKEWEADYIIVAEGSKNYFSLESGEKRHLETIMAWYDNYKFRQHYMEMYYTTELIPGYGWVFPESNSLVNIGICRIARKGQTPLRKIFENFTNKYLEDKLKDAHMIDDKLWTHPIVYSIKPTKVVEKNVIWLGEAGRLTDPATGEGIYQALKSAELVSLNLGKAIDNGRLELLRNYQKDVILNLYPRQLFGYGYIKFASTPLFKHVFRLSKNQYLSNITSRILSKV